MLHNNFFEYVQTNWIIMVKFHEPLWRPFLIYSRSFVEDIAGPIVSESVSSGNNLIWFSKLIVISLIYTKNRNGLSTETWGTPAFVLCFRSFSICYKIWKIFLCGYFYIIRYNEVKFVCVTLGKKIQKKYLYVMMSSLFYLFF